MRVVHVIARFNKGGTAVWLANLIEGQLIEGDEVWLLAGHTQEGEEEDSRFSELNGFRIRKMARSISPVNDFISFLEIRRKLREIRPDIINTHTAKAGMVGRLAALSLGKNRPAIVHTYHGHVLYGYFGKSLSKVFAFIEKLLTKITDLILVSGVRVKNELISVGIGKESQYVVVRPGVVPINLSNKSTIRRKLFIPDNKIVIGWLGRISQIKRPDRVIDLARVFPDLIFLIGGDGELLKSIKDGSPTNVVFLGWTTPSIVWSASDIALLTSDNEAQPLSLIEAGSARLPLIGEDVGSVSEVIQEGQSGFLTHNQEERVSAIDKLTRDSEMRSKMGEMASRVSQDLFGVQQFIKSHREAYQKLVSQQKS